METLEAIRQRKSIRAFTPQPVSREDLEKVVGAAVAAPSKGNCQIWEFIAVTGDRKRALDAMLLNLLKTDFMPAMQLGDNDENEEAGEALKKAATRSEHNKAEMKRILTPLGLAFDDFMLEGTFSFFNAPVAVLVFVDEVFARDLPHILSVGAAMQNMLLAAADMGLGTCWIGGVWRYTKEIRKFLNVPDNKRLLSSMALGHPDLDSPVSGYKSTRDGLDEFIRLIGFD